MTTNDGKGNESENAADVLDPNEILDAFEKQMVKKIKEFDIRLIQGRKELEQIKTSLTTIISDCQKSLYDKIDDLDKTVTDLLNKVVNIK